jgi:hypothetical protein
MLPYVAIYYTTERSPLQAQVNLSIKTSCKIAFINFSISRLRNLVECWCLVLVPGAGAWCWCLVLVPGAWCWCLVLVPGEKKAQTLRSERFVWLVGV